MFICLIKYSNSSDANCSKYFLFRYSKYVVAVALPIDLPGRNIYVSYNFEANYVLPSSSTDFTQGFYDKIFFVDGVESEENENTARTIKRHSFISRKHVYEMIQQKMNAYGLNGYDCLLRIICETSNSNFYETNGVFGSLFHILFT